MGKRPNDTKSTRASMFLRATGSKRRTRIEKASRKINPQLFRRRTRRIYNIQKVRRKGKLVMIKRVREYKTKITSRL